MLTLPTTFRPRVPFVVVGLMLLGAGLGWTLFKAPSLGPEVPLQFTWYGEPTRMVARTPLTQYAGLLYGSVGCVVLLLVNRLARPQAALSVTPPSEDQHIAPHLHRALASALAGATAVYMAYVGLAIQIGSVFIASGHLEVASHRTFNNTWFMAGLMLYCFYTAWQILAMNALEKRARYGDIALEAGALIGPSNGPAHRVAPAAPRPAPSPPAHSGLVD